LRVLKFHQREVPMSAADVAFAHHGEQVHRKAPTLEEVRSWGATLSIAQACQALGYSVAWGYELAAAGEFPCRVLTVRGRKRVITASLLELLGGGDDGA
jgi:hypothetical protein